MHPFLFYYIRNATDCQPIILANAEIIIQSAIPINVGKTTAKKVHLKLFVSLYIVRQVVAQGKCISEKTITQSAVTVLQPFAVNNSPSAAVLSKSVILPDAV